LPYEEELGPGFCFATTGRGSWYWIAASDERATDSPVIYLDYDGGGSHGKIVADSLEVFLHWPALARLNFFYDRLLPTWHDDASSKLHLECGSLAPAFLLGLRRLPPIRTVNRLLRLLPAVVGAQHAAPLW